MALATARHDLGGRAKGTHLHNLLLRLHLCLLPHHDDRPLLLLREAAHGNCMLRQWLSLMRGGAGTN